MADYSQPTPEEAVLMDELYVSLLEHLRKIKLRYAIIAKLSREGFSHMEGMYRKRTNPVYRKHLHRIFLYFQMCIYTAQQIHSVIK
ncbi:MAG: hypothetical protein LIO81_08970 [Clostridiales bacterium]|nr:hypothetical protein [Clostridiales bacterium]